MIVSSRGFCYNHGLNSCDYQKGLFFRRFVMRQAICFTAVIVMVLGAAICGAAVEEVV